MVETAGGEIAPIESRISATEMVRALSRSSIVFALSAWEEF
jgi:hypothetical protein